MTTTLSSTWLKDLDKEREKELRAEYAASPVLRSVLKSILLRMREEKEKESISKSGYDNPNWTYLQADSCGYKRALQDIFNILDK